MSRTHAVLRIRRNGLGPQNTLFIVNYDKEDIDYYYRTLRYLEKLDEDENETESEGEQEDQQDEDEVEADEEIEDEATPSVPVSPETPREADGMVALAVSIGGLLGIYLFIFLLWLGGQFPPRLHDGEL